MKNLMWVIIFGLITATANAQPPKKIAFEKYNVAEGLPEEYVVSLIQDDKGFIWAATQNGLVKYDGYQFKVYKVSSDSSQTTELQIKNLLGGLLKTKDGLIWMGASLNSGGMVTSFNPESEQFRNYFLPEIIFGRRRGTSYLLHEDAQHYIWVLNLWESMANTCRLNPKNGTIKFYPDLLMLNRALFPIIKNNVAFESSVWMLDTHSNLKKFNHETDSFETIISGGNSFIELGKTDTIRWILEAGNNQLFLNSDHAFSIYDVQKKIVRHQTPMAYGMKKVHPLP
jgi:ligand-binding sensor domain-containing protein